MDMVFKFPTREQMWGFVDDCEAYAKSSSPDIEILSQWGGSLDCRVTGIPDNEVENVSEMASKFKGVGVKTAATEEAPEIKEGEDVIWTVDNRPGKVTTINAHVCTVEFSDGKNPEVRQVWVADLKPAKKTEASKPKADIKAKLRELTASARQETAPERFQHKMITIFAEKYLPAQPWDKVVDAAYKENRGDMLDVVASLRAEGKTLKEGGLKALLAHSNIRGTLNDVFWPQFLLMVEADLESHRDPKHLPERVLLDALDKLEQSEQHNSLSTEDRAELHKLLDEQAKRGGEADATKDHVVTSVKAVECPDCQEVIAVKGDEKSVDCPSCGKQVSAKKAQDFPMSVVTSDLDHEQIEEPINFEESPFAQEADEVNDGEEDELGDRVRQVFSGAHDKGDAEDMPGMHDLFGDEEQDEEGHATPDTRDLRTLPDGLGEDMDIALGLKAPQEVAHAFQLGAVKTAAEIEVPLDLFDGTAGDFSHTERFLGAMVAEDLVEGRPRLLANKSELINKASDAFSTAMRSLHAGYSAEHVSLNEIRAEKVEENTGLMLKGLLAFHVTLAAHAYRRKVSMDLMFPVLGGEPQPELVYCMTTTGHQIPFTKESLDKAMGVRRNQAFSGKTPPQLDRAFIIE
jgi:predicted RNA-binding Zn-ribbon protein involved in translation (DUF1610 family)